MDNETMYIYAQKGHRVVFTHPNAGRDDEIKDAAEYLTVGETYTVDKTEVHSFHTNVWLEEIPDVYFNNCMFDDA